MKILILILMISIGSFEPGERGLYTLQFKDWDGSLVKMSDFKGKKIVVSILRTDSVNVKRLSELNSLFKIYQDHIKVIVVPLTDFGEGPLPQKNLKAILIDSLKLPFTIASQSKGRKLNSGDQHVLLQWLTHKSQNNHFDNDIEKEERLFVISGNGILFADLKGNIDLQGAFMKKILEQSEIQEGGIKNISQSVN